jgi:type II restriction/modification system DNA methylase subunit YeeA
MAHLGERAFDTIGGAVVSTTAFVIENDNRPEFKGGYLRLVGGGNESEKDRMLRGNLPVAGTSGPGEFYEASASGFRKTPGSQIAYWAPSVILDAFELQEKIGDKLDTAQGMKTLDNERFIREWSEIAVANFSLFSTHRNNKWFPINHGGEFRKWYGNNESVINWYDNGKEIKELAKKKYNSVTRTVTGMGHYFEKGITWTAISTGKLGVRCFPKGFLFTNAGMCAFGKPNDLDFSCSMLNSCVSMVILEILSPTINYGPNQIQLIPLKLDASDIIKHNFSILHEIAKMDWNSHETSWDFTSLPLFDFEYRKLTLKVAFTQLSSHWKEMRQEMQELEEENNRIFIDAYGLQDELTPDVPLEEITLTCNPHYRYAAGKTEDEYDKLLLADTMKDFISYAVGCMFGRYSLDKPGLILANQGETAEDYHKQIPNPSFEPEDDNVIPILDRDWFMDDMAGRFHRFLRITFGETHYEENMAFIENAVGKDIRKYFLKDFYKDHLKRYKKRPIYWLFSSPKDSFNVLIYMHRYRPDTVSIVLNDYLREFRTKLMARREHLEQISISASASSAEKTRALKEIEKLKKTIDELENYEGDTLYPLAAQKVEIELDDGVKVNYKKFGKALKKVPGVSS